MLKPVELEIELFCRGMRIDPSCHTGEDGRRIARTRAGLGSGLEIVIPNRPKAIWVNVPVVEPFAQASPLVLHKQGERYAVVDVVAREHGIAVAEAVVDPHGAGVLGPGLAAIGLRLIDVRIRCRWSAPSAAARFRPTRW